MLAESGAEEVIVAECKPLAVEHVIPDLGASGTLRSQRRDCLSAQSYVGILPPPPQ